MFFSRYPVAASAAQRDEDIQRRMTFASSKRKKGRPSAERIFSDTVMGVAIIETMDDVDEEARPTFDLDLLDACLIPVESVEAIDALESPLRINGLEPTFECFDFETVERDGKKKKFVFKTKKDKLQAQRLEKMRESGYVVFDDAFLRRYPDSRIARVSQQYASAYPLDAPPARVPKTGKSKRCKRAAYFVSAAEKEKRPCFRRCPSELFYGRAQYTDLMERGIPLTSSFYSKTQGDDSLSNPSKPKPKVSKLSRIFKNFSTNSLDRGENSILTGGGSCDDREVGIPPRVASISIRA